MKKVLIIEDEMYSALRLKRLISDIDDTTDIHGPLKSIAEVVAELSVNNDYDIIFSDIRLIDGEVFEAFRKVRPNAFVIFTTAYDEYAMQAIKNNGLDYLMKPVDFNELCTAVEKLQMTYKQGKNTVQKDMEGLLKDTFQYRERFLVCKGDELIVLYVDDINYFYVDDNHVFAFTNTDTSYQLPTTMNALEQELDPNKFFRINRQYIANIKGIKKISMFFSSKLIVRIKGCKDNNIIISKEKSAQFKKWLDR